MLSLIKKYFRPALIALVVISQVTACNKIPEVEEITKTSPSGETIADLINTRPEYSLLKLAASKSGMLPLLGNPDATLTLFAVDNAAFELSGISEPVINALPAEQLAAILSYHIIGQKIPAASIPETFPNQQWPSLLQLPTAPAIIKMPTFLSRRGTTAFVNNIPIKAADIAASNGVIHNVFAVVAPPQRVLLDSIARDASLSYFVAAIQRADLGLPDGSKFSQILANPLANFTVFAPTNDAFNALFTAIGLPPDISVIQALPVQTVIGIVAYHIHILDGTAGSSNIKFSRAFTVNFPATPTPIETFLNVITDPAPPLVIDAALGVKGYVNPTFSKIIGPNRNAVNGVFHKIDQVLLPQPPM
jgi:uncharacterized surface protein with fasciclin (FAS1) repeats